MSTAKTFPAAPVPWRIDREQGAGGGTAVAGLPSWTGVCLKAFLGITVGLYILNQKHLLPKPLSRLVSKALFWPTLPITFGKRFGEWFTVIDDTVIIGGAPFGFAKVPEKLYRDHGVRKKS